MSARAWLGAVVLGGLVLGAGTWVAGMPRPESTVAVAAVLPSAAGAPTAAGAGGAGAGGAGPTGASADPVAPDAVAGSGLDPAWVDSVSAATGIPRIALAAYGRASRTVAASDPGCHLAWNTLAGLGEVESGHGTAAGHRLGADGTVTPSVVGPVLDGSGVAAVGDTDGGRVDGDRRWDRAVGPLQFLPGSWRRYAADGNGDGRTDPQNVFDAALAAAHYLCVAGGDLSAPGAWVTAVKAYNHSDEYVDAVRDAADRYARETGS